MIQQVTRREVLVSACALAAAPTFALAADPVAAPSVFPQQDPALAKEIVGASHRSIERVKALLAQLPQLANATYDWGFGDWESALGAASHTGRREIAELLMAHGARPDLFTHAMLGHLEVVKAALAARPELARLRGPHGLTLAHHARAGGDAAAAVTEYLKSIDGADVPYTNLDLTDADRNAVVGSYRFGPAPTELLEVFQDKSGPTLSLKRVEGNTLRLFHQGKLIFHSAGAPDVRIVFEVSDGVGRKLTISGPAPLCEATRIAQA